ncbi:MAG: polyhydroxyalkanoic acid system family protein [Verrucomicrobiota bacterium]
MPSIKLSVPHRLGADEAKNRITKLISDTKEKFGGQVSDVRESWNGNRSDFGFKAMGFDVAGNLQVQPATVDIEINLPLAALLFKSRVESEISSRAKELLA